MDEHFKNLFAGSQTRFLTFTTMTERDDGKQMPDYRTFKRAPSDADWARHLKGEVSLGLSPLHDGMVKWGAVDVDFYRKEGPLLQNDDEVAQFLKAWGDPCLIANTKSRGIHIIAFSKEPVDADVMRKYLEAKRDAVLEGDLLAAAKEIFPKQSEGDGSQMNLPSFGEARSVVGWSGSGIIAHVSPNHPADWAEIEARCHVSGDAMARTIVAALTPKKRGRPPTQERKKYAGGFRRPKDAEGRRDYIWRCACSARERGADRDQLEEIIQQVNDEFADPQSEFGNKGPITDKNRLDVILKEVLKFDQGTPSDLPFEIVERMNDEWAVLMVDGKVEFLHRPSGVVYPLRDFSLRTKPMTCMVAGKVRQMSDVWIADRDRLEFDGIVIEAPDYDGPGWNVFEGWGVEPKLGDASLWVDYVERILCGGDKDLAHWVMSYVADGVQRPWSKHPGTALALRGPQGGGKSFLGKMIQRILLPAQAQEVADSDRLFERFNRGMFGATFVLAEESLFAGSKRQANILKVFITSHVWKYEQKFLASFEGKNVHRVIATTNEDQAVHLDADDRRWTVIEVAQMFDDPESKEARDYWAPYYDMDPSVVLAYLLQYEVDRDLIGRPCITAAKQDDKISSDPVLEVLHEIAVTGIVPDDIEARGKLASGALYREARALGASPYDTPRKLSERAKNILGRRGTCRDAMHIKEYQRTVDGNGYPSLHAVFENGGYARGIDLGTLADFRAAVAKRTRKEYPTEGDWRAFKPPMTEWVRDGDPADVERLAKDEDVPF